MYIEILEWFLALLDSDGHDLREKRGEMKMAIRLMEQTGYSFEQRHIMEALIGLADKEAPNAE